MLKYESAALSKEYQKITASILHTDAAYEVYRGSGMAIERGDGGVIGVVYETEEGTDETIKSASESL